MPGGQPGAALRGGYGCSASKGDIHHPRVQVFTENVVGIELQGIYYLLAFK